jgi:hypothetical protein
MRITTNQASGAAISVLGLSVGTYSLSLHIGKLSQMGPGFFPLAIGLAFLIVGAIIFFLNDPHPDELKITIKEVKAVCITLAAVCLFALLSQYLGMIIACIVLVVVGRYSIDHGTFKDKIKLALILTVSSVLIFWYGLNMNLKLFSTLFW